MTVMLYRAAEAPNPDVWGLNVEHRVFAEAEVDAALAEGWVRHPSDLGTSSDGVEVQPKRKGRPPKEG